MYPPKFAEDTIVEVIEVAMSDLSAWNAHAQRRGVTHERLLAAAIANLLASPERVARAADQVEPILAASCRNLSSWHGAARRRGVRVAKLQAMAIIDTLAGLMMPGTDAPYLLTDHCGAHYWTADGFVPIAARSCAGVWSFDSRAAAQRAASWLLRQQIRVRVARREPGADLAGQ
jgi:hypothetical protein